MLKPPIVFSRYLRGGLLFLFFGLGDKKKTFLKVNTSLTFAEHYYQTPACSIVDRKSPDVPAYCSQRGIFQSLVAAPWNWSWGKCSACTVWRGRMLGLRSSALSASDKPRWPSQSDWSLPGSAPKHHTHSPVPHLQNKKITKTLLYHFFMYISCIFVLFFFFFYNIRIVIKHSFKEKWDAICRQKIFILAKCHRYNWILVDSLVFHSINNPCRPCLTERSSPSC